VTPWSSPTDRASAKWLSEFEWTPELLADYAQRARDYLDRLYGRPEPLQFAHVCECDDCGRERPLLLYGRLAICSACASLRQRACEGAASQLVRDDQPVPEAVPTLPESWEAEQRAKRIRTAIG
jgi:hypothetical protein